MKKGFTLIELLAVIVILAVISLIAVPIILNIVEDSKQNAIKSSAQLYVDGLTKRIVSENLQREFNPSSCTVANGNVSCDGETLDYTVDGHVPTSGTISFNNGVVTGYTLDISGYTVTKSGDSISITKITSVVFNGTYVVGGQNDTYIGIAYLDPTDLSRTCTAQLAAQNVDRTTHMPTEIKSGCMKFYVYADDGDNYTMILDHNTTAIAGFNGDDSSVILGALTNDTEGWEGNPRLISADEIAHIVGADRSDTLQWDSSLPSGTNVGTQISWFYLDGSGNSYDGWEQHASNTSPSSYHWLYDYTGGCNEYNYGCIIEDSNTYGEYDSTIESYFTDTVDSAYGYSWLVIYVGMLTVGDNAGGIRPVITLPKNLFVPQNTQLPSSVNVAYTPGQLLQYDPVSNAKCTSGATCYKWRVITVGDTTSNPTITLQMDHNIIDYSAWASQTDYNDDTNWDNYIWNDKGPITALKALETATSTWSDSLRINYSYNTASATNNYGVLSCVNGVCTTKRTIITSNLKARMITGEEVAALTVAAGASSNSAAGRWILSNGGDFYFSSTDNVIGTSNVGTGNTTLAWLVENTYVVPFGDNTSGATFDEYKPTNGYWTLSPKANNSGEAWYVYFDGILVMENGVDESYTLGIRPVITISKSIFE